MSITFSQSDMSCFVSPAVQNPTISSILSQWTKKTRKYAHFRSWDSWIFAAFQRKQRKLSWLIYRLFQFFSHKFVWVNLRSLLDEHVGKLSKMTSADASHSLSHWEIPSHTGRVGVHSGNPPSNQSEEDIFHKSQWLVMCSELRWWRFESGSCCSDQSLHCSLLPCSKIHNPSLSLKKSWTRPFRLSFQGLSWERRLCQYMHTLIKTERGEVNRHLHKAKALLDVGSHLFVGLMDTLPKCPLTVVFVHFICDSFLLDMTKSSFFDLDK